MRQSGGLNEHGSSFFTYCLKLSTVEKKKRKTVDVNNPPKIEISSIGRMIFRISNMFGQVDEL